jgi:hypothetical protein
MGRGAITEALPAATLCGRHPNDADCMMCPDILECGELKEEVAYFHGLVDQPKKGDLKKEGWI